MNFGRHLTHFAHGRWRLHACFPPDVLKVIETAIWEDERRHGGQIRFAIETALEWNELRAGLSARERAIDVFSHLRVWDTERNNGVLIYVLLADRDVEIVADRGIHALAGAAAWEDICRHMESEFREGRFREGALEGVHRVGNLMAAHFPPIPGARDELPNRPVIL